MKAVLSALLLGCLVLVFGASAQAQCADEACVRASAQLTSVNSQQSALLNATLNMLLGNGSAVALTTADDTSLANSNIKLSDLTSALNSLGVGTDSTTALTTTTSLKNVLNAASAAAMAEGNISTANALAKLATQTNGVNTQGVRLADLITADSRTGPLGSAQLNALDLVTGTASLFNSRNVAVLNNVTLTGASLGLPSTITNVTLSAVVIEPAVFVCGPVGSQFYSANIRLRVHLALTGSGVDLNVAGLASAHLDLASLDLVAAVGRATGTIQAINAAAATLTVSATPGLASLYLGTVSDADFINRAVTTLDPSVVTPAVIANLTLKLALITATASVSARSIAQGVNPTPTTLLFTGPYPQTQTAITSSSSASNLVTTLLNNLQITVGTISPSLGLPLQTLVQNLVTAITGTLSSTSGILAPLLTAATNTIIDPLLSALGVKLGQVSVTANAPYKVTAGSTCNDNNACTDGDICSATGVCAGVAKTCSDGLDCTTDTCNATTGACTSAVAGAFCLINGACVGAGNPDPSNACNACDPAVPGAYSPRAAGAPCDDGQFCTQNDACSLLGTCTGTPRLCTDGLLCTTDICDEANDVCANAITIGCVIGGACVLPGTDDPSNQCRTCNPAISTASFSNKTQGAPCVDGLFCTVGDACDGAGSCTSTPRNCEDGLGCTTNTCNEATGACTSALNGSCLINGSCIPAGPDPSNPCRVCNPSVSPNAYVNAPTTTACSDGLFCTTNDSCNGLGLCVGTPRVCDPSGLGCTSVCSEADATCKTGTQGCSINGACIAPGADDPTNPCRSCVPTVSTTAWTNKASGVSCSDGQYCTVNDSCNGSGTCTGSARACNDGLDCTTDTCDETNDRCNTALTGGCVINGACVAGGTVDPSNPCQSCNPNASTAAWTALANNTPCDDKLFCTTGDKCNGEARCVGTARDCNAGNGTCASVCDELNDQCRSGLLSCVIDGLCLALGAVDPTNPCRECNPALSLLGWSLRDVGVSCDDGQFCTTGDTCNAAGACVGAPMVCAGSSSSMCGTSCNEALDTCGAGVSGCVIDGVCRATGDSNPANSCQVCNPLLNAAGWSPKGAGTSCSDGLFCTSNDTCDANGVCAGTATACSDGLTCTTDTCDESSRSCKSTVTSGCLINNVCYADTDPDPNNACRACVSATSRTGFTPLAQNATCDDGKFCTINDSCNGSGVCLGSARSCSAGSDCSSFCDEASDSCRDDVEGCAIGELCAAAGTDDPSNSCRTCDPSRSTSDWSLKSTGTACSDGLFCTTGDVCDSTGKCSGATQDCSDSQTCTVDTCDESAGACKHATGGSCIIDGACVQAGTFDPTSTCRVCDPTKSTTGWTSVAINTTCDDKQFCTVVDVCDGAGNCIGAGSACLGDTGDCTTQVCDETTDSCRVSVSNGCRINSVCVAEGAVSKTDPCMVCVSAQSTSAYTFVGTAANCKTGDGGTGMGNMLPGVNDDGGTDGSVGTVRDAGTTGPIDEDNDAGTRRGGGLSGGALCAVSDGSVGSEAGVWLVALAGLGLVTRRRRRHG